MNTNEYDEHDPNLPSHARYDEDDEPTLPSLRGVDVYTPNVPAYARGSYAALWITGGAFGISAGTLTRNPWDFVLLVCLYAASLVLVGHVVQK